MQPTTLMSLDIKFETADIIPAPFSHQIVIKAELDKPQLPLSFEILYTYRDDLSEEEILEEGFTSNDNFTWKGQLDNSWKESILQLVAQTPDKFSSKALEEESNFLEVTFNRNEKGVPKNQESWEYLLQELMQAVFETAEKEAPLYIIFVEIDQQKKANVLEVSLQFAKRKAVAFLSNETEKQEKDLEWEMAKELIHLVFVGEFLPEKATTVEPKTPGKFISTGDGIWYEFSKSLKNPNGNRYYLNDLTATWKEIESL